MHGFIHRHSGSEGQLFQHSPVHGPPCLWTQTCSPTATVPSKSKPAQEGLAPGCSPCRVFLPWPGFIHSHTISGAPGRPHEHWCFKLYLLQPDLALGLMPAGCSCCGTAMSMGTSRCTCFGMDLFMAREASGYPAPTWTHPQVTVPLT